MSRTITAMFDSRSEAEAARQRLAQSNIDAGSVRIVDQADGQPQAGGTQSGESGGFWSALKDAFMPEEDRYAYHEGVRRGGCLLCAQVDESRADDAVRILEETGSVDFDRRQEQWRSEGWTGGGAAFQQQQSRQQQTGEQGRVAEERIPIVEEQMKVGKREVERGGARVRSYVEETPVSEQVKLREEHVSVERRPVDRPVGSGDLDADLLRDREISMTETSEEAVVGKEARVREEVVVRKEAAERTETVQDKVRHTEVEVDDLGKSGDARPAFGFSGDERGDRQNPAAQDRSEERTFERGDTSRR